MDQDKSCIAIFGNPTLTVVIQGNGFGTVISQPLGIQCDPTCNASFLAGTPVALAATPTPTSGSVFTGWSGDCMGTNSVYSLTMDQDKSCTATFASGNPTFLNGDFESPSIPDGTYQSTTPSSWNGGAFLFNPNAVGGIIHDPSVAWPQAQNGQQYEDIGNTASFSLSQTFTIASSSDYTFTWYDNTTVTNLPPSLQTAPYSISLFNSSLQPVFSQNFNSYHAGMWQLNTVSQTLTPGTYTLTFTSLNLPSHTDTLIDNVRVGP